MFHMQSGYTLGVTLHISRTIKINNPKTVTLNAAEILTYAKLLKRDIVLRLNMRQSYLQRYLKVYVLKVFFWLKAFRAAVHSL